MLPQQLLLPGMQHKMVPFREAVYSGGDKCEGQQGTVKRQARVGSTSTTYSCRVLQCVCLYRPCSPPGGVDFALMSGNGKG